MTIKTPETRITAARTKLLLDFPWFGSLAMRLKITASQEHPTFAVDGTNLFFNPDFLGEITDTELVAVLAHEVMHCALLHPYRRGNRDAKTWNQATAYVINSEIVSAGMKLPDGCLIDSQYAGLSAEVVYAQLQQQPQPAPQQQPQPEPTGEVLDAPAPAPSGSGQSDQMTESDWKIATEQASDVAKGCGNLPGSAHRAIQQARKSIADWRSILREFIAQTIPSDYSWLTPNRRYIHRGIYLPGISKENCGHLAIAVDTSGSISPALLSAFAEELTAISHECHPEKITVLYCDTQVNRTEEFTDSDEITLSPCGGGGTLFTPVFSEIADWEESPACLLYFTDLDSYDTPPEPEYPVMWVTDLAVTRDGYFGSTLRVSTEGS